MPWAPEDFQAVAEACGLGGLRTIYPWPERPTLGVTVDMRPMGLLASSGAINNPYLTQVMRAMQESRQKAMAAEAVGEASPLEWFETQDRVLDYHDVILTAIIKDPPWCPKADIPPDGITPGRLNIYMFSDDTRRALVAIPYEGASALGSLFRPLTNGVEPAPNGASLRGAAEPLVSVAAAASEVLVGRGDVVRLPGVDEPASGSGGDPSAA